jgi:tetratricopeptide (TPR) repeat protein
MLARRMTTATRTLALVFGLLAGTMPGPAASAEFIRQMNLGKAHLENRNSAKAIEAFAAAVKLAPQSAPALRNLARAQLLAGQNEEVLASLAKARALEPDSVATAYLAGLAHVHESRFEQAVPWFEAAVRLDPHTATLRFQLANAYQLSRDEERALVQYRETVRLDPLHASAQFKLATFARRRGDRAEADQRQREFQRLRALFGEDSRTPAALERCGYTQPEPPELEPLPAPAAIPVRFTDATRDAFPAAPAPAVAADVLEVDTNASARGSSWPPTGQPRCCA